MWLIRLFFHINVDQEAQAFDAQSSQSRNGLTTMNVALQNVNLSGLAVNKAPGLSNGQVICSRIHRGDTLSVPRPLTTLQVGDLRHLVGAPDALRSAQLVIGEEVETSLSTHDIDMRIERTAVAPVKAIGKRISDLALACR